MGPLLLLGGKKKSLSFPTGQSDEFSSLKAESRLCFFGSASEPECLEATGTSPLGECGELIADKVQSGVFALEKWMGNENDPSSESLRVLTCMPACVHVFVSVCGSACELFSQGSAGLCWHAATRAFQGERLRKCPWHVLCIM